MSKAKHPDEKVIRTRKGIVDRIRKAPWKQCGSVGRYLKRTYG